MTRIPSKTLLWVALALALVPAVVAQSVLGSISDLWVQLFGPGGLGVYASGAGGAIIDSIIALVIFIGLSMRVLSKRIGGAAAGGLGAALAIAFVVGMQTFSFSFAKLAPFAIIIVIILTTYLLYWVASLFGNNKLAAFAVAFAIMWAFARELFDAAFFESFKTVFTILNLVWVICIIIVIFLAVCLVAPAAGVRLAAAASPAAAHALTASRRARLTGGTITEQNEHKQNKLVLTRS
jgi:hypothetical protein